MPCATTRRLCCCCCCCLHLERVEGSTQVCRMNLAGSKQVVRGVHAGGVLCSQHATTLGCCRDSCCCDQAHQVLVPKERCCPARLCMFAAEASCTARQVQGGMKDVLVLETSTSAAASRLTRARKLPLSAFLSLRDEVLGLTDLVEQTTR